MNDSKQGRGPKQETDRRSYEAPTVQSYTGEEILEIVGPAQGYSGDPIGTPSGGSL